MVFSDRGNVAGGLYCLFGVLGMNKFTSGPWEVADHECYPGMIVVKGPESPITIVTSAIDIDIASHVRRISDAHLIAAAPDLLAALEDMLAGWKYIRESHGDLYGVGWDRAQDKATAAIARARGAK